MVFSLEKYSLDSETFALSRVRWEQISRSGSQKNGISAVSLEESTFATESSDRRPHD